MMAQAGMGGGLAPGSELNGTYVIVRLLFEGGMGDIYEARHVRLTGHYAVKVLRHTLTTHHASAFDRFRREAEVTSSLRHPHIVQVVDFNQVPGGAAYFVMELLEGQNLRQYLDTHGPMPLPEVVVVLEQVASALQAAHERGVVHRDLKPDNIHLASASSHKGPFAKVLDFGISKVLTASTLTQDAMLVGTPHYMAPEQALGGSDDLDGRTDQFSLGAIAHELLTGRRIFDAENVAAIIYQVLHEQPPSLGPLVGEAVDAAVQRALSKNRDDRFASVTEFADAVRKAAFGPPRTSLAMLPASTRSGSSDLPTLALTPASASPPAAPATGRGRRLALILLAASVVAAGALAGVLATRRPAPTWSAAEGDAVAVGAQLDAAMRRILDDENAQFAATIARAAEVSQLANAITGRVDEITFQDLLANELWWSDFRTFGCAVLVEDSVKIVWHLPVAKTAAATMAALVRPPKSTGAARVALVTEGVPGAGVLAGVATIEGVPGGRLLFVRPVDRALLTDLATRANTILMLSDGKQLLGLSVPDNTIPEIGLLVGKEGARVLVDSRHGRLASAVLWSRGLWLWGVTGWSS